MHLLSHAVCIFPRRKVRLKKDKWWARGPSYSDGAGFNLSSVWLQSLFPVHLWRKQLWCPSCLPLKCGEPDLMLSSPHLSSVPQLCGWPWLFSCEVLGGMTTSIWALVTQVLVLGHVLAKVSQEVTKKQLPGFVAHERAPLWPSPVRLKWGDPAGDRMIKTNMLFSASCRLLPNASFELLRTNMKFCSENLPEWAYTPTF